MKLNLGSGDNDIAGFISVDKYDKEADVHCDIVDLPYGDESIDEIVCYQVIEHIHIAESTQVFEEMWRVMKPGAKAIVETPDIDYVCGAILRDGLLDKWIWNLVGQYYRPHDKGRYEDWYHQAGSIHRNPWNEQRIRSICEDLGFEVRRRSMEEIAPIYQYPETLSIELTKL